MKTIRKTYSETLIISILLVSLGMADTVSTNQPNPQKTVPHRGSSIPERQLAEDGYDTTEEGLRRALNSSDNYDKICAMRVMRKQAMKSLLPEVGNQLTNSWCPVRVEAGMTLLELGDPKGAPALRKEVERGDAIVQDVLNGKRSTLGTIAGDIDVDYCVQAAGALAESGDSSGYALVKTVLLSFPTRGCNMDAAMALPKFVRFENTSSGIKPRELLVQAADNAIKAVEETKAQGKEDQYRSQAARFRVIARSLAEAGGPEARAKLLQATTHADPKVREHAATFLNALDKKAAPVSNSTKAP